MTPHRKIGAIQLKHLILLSLIAGLFIIGSGIAQGFDEPPVLFETAVSLSGVTPGGEIILAGVFKVPPDHHITDPAHGLFYLEVKWPDGTVAMDTVWPEGEIEQDEKVFRGEVAILHKVEIPVELESGDYQISYSYSYQICRDIEPKTCFMPNGGSGAFTLQVLEAGSTPIPSSHPVFADMLKEYATETVTVEGDLKLEDRLTLALEHGSLVAFLLVFLAGILVSFTPCVYPMIPIIIGFVGAGAGGSKARGFILSVFFVIGLALMYASLGVAAGATGALFGAMMANPVVLWVIVGIFITLGASMLGAFNIALPASVQGKLMSGQRQGIIGALIMGAVTGIVAAPCAGPPLLVLLGWIGKTGSLVLGFFLMAVFALGIGVLFIVIGTFAGAMTALPQAGPWMDKIKKGLGVLIFGVALYYLNMLLPEGLFTLVLGFFLLLVGLFFGALAKWEELSTAGRYGKGLGLVLVLAGAFYILLGLARHHELPIVTSGRTVSGAASLSTTPQDHVAWRVNEHDMVLAEALEVGKPVLIDFYADWCVVCVELDHKVWNRPEVIEASRAYLPLKLDFTRSSPELEKLRSKYGIGGLPTVIILGPDGSERSRFSSFKSPDEVVNWLDEHS